MPPASHTPGYFRLLVRFLRPFPNIDLAFIEPLRAKAVSLLRLSPGSRVLDLGCGPGGSFPFLAEAVGPTGEVVGVEISSDVAENATRRIARNQWSNVHVVVAPADSVQLAGVYDGALMFGASGVYASPRAVANVLPYLKPGARLVFFGAKTSTRRTGWILNPVLRLVFPKFSFATTPVPDESAWSVLAPHLGQLEVAEYCFGWMFLASGTYTRAIVRDPRPRAAV